MKRPFRWDSPSRGSASCIRPPGERESPTGVYQIQYVDGTTAEIVLVENENIFGWTRAPAEFARERGTRSRVAWTGTTPLFPVICVSQMMWLNPKPDVPVRAVRFANPQKNMCPVLIALTAAVRPSNANLAAIAAAQAKAKEWFKKGIDAASAGHDAEARAALQEGAEVRRQVGRRLPVALRA